MTVGKRVMGLVVDAVSDVLNIDKSEIQAPPDLGATVDTSFMTGMARAGERLVMLLNVERLMGNEDTGVPA